jgi:sodium/bile acid cotransporter 7
MNGILKQLSRVGLNFFFLCLILVVLLAWLFPEAGSENSGLPLHQIINYGVAVIFFFYGVKLDPHKLLAGLQNWKLHVLIQATTFILFPVVTLVLIHFFGGRSDILWLGIFYLAALPSTVSSSVVMVSIAGGNVASAIFNASISSILGIFFTPLWMSLFIDQSQESIDLTNVILMLCLQVLLPVVAGLLLHRLLATWVDRNKTWLRIGDQFIILLIVFTAFSHSFLGNMFSGFTGLEVVWLSFGMLFFFLFMALIMHLISMRLKFSLEDRITIIFCGSKKSLVQGAVMGNVLFPNPVMLGIILLPLMLYHALQLMAGSTLAQAIAHRHAGRID